MKGERFHFVKCLAIVILILTVSLVLFILSVEKISSLIVHGRMIKMTPYDAVERCTTEDLFLLITKFGHDVDERNSEGESALFSAIRHNDVSGVVVLLRLGARTNIVSKSGETPNTIAARQPDSVILESLLDTRAEGAQFDEWLPRSLRCKIGNKREMGSETEAGSGLDGADLSW